MTKARTGGAHAPLDPYSSPRRRQTRRAAIAHVLEEEIGKGRWPIDSLLPSESTLTLRFGVSRQTLRFALSDMRARGLVQSRQGVGTVVARRTAEPEFTHSFQTIDELVDYTRNSTGRTVRSDDVVLDASMADRIGASQGETWRRTITVRTALGQRAPMGLNVTWVPQAYGRVFLLSRRSGLPVFIELQKLIGEPISRVRQVCGAALPDKAQAKLLQCGAQEALLCIGRWYFTAAGTLLGLSETLHPPARFQYAVMLRRATNDA